MGFSIMLWGAEKLVPAEYWCPYGNGLLILSVFFAMTNTQSSDLLLLIDMHINVFIPVVTLGPLNGECFMD